MRTFIIFWVSVSFHLVMGQSPFRLEYDQNEHGRMVRVVNEEESPSSAGQFRKRPIRNPQIMANVNWCDRNHQNAIAERSAITPDGYGIFVSWDLNNERYAAYLSPGLSEPIWTYAQLVDMAMPVAASSGNYVGTGQSLPIFVWQHDSPLYTNRIELDNGFQFGGMDFSGDGNLLAVVSSNGNNGCLHLYDMEVLDTIYTRSFYFDTGLNGVAISNDGSIVVVSMYDNLIVYDVPAGDTIAEIYNRSGNVAEVSGDGSLIVNGENHSVILYERDQSGYVLRWNKPIGDQWVVDIDISDDGSCFACGIFESINNQIFGGRFIMWDSGTGDELIDYDEYGDMVAGVDLSANGRYAIVGSWGQYNGTFGDVVTCFIRDTNVPILQILDDLDEPGSVYSVAISDSGHYAVASGKAVHARQMGNGGMVYSIKLNDPLDHDVAVSSIEEPGEFVYPGEEFTPTATVINVGSNAESFNIECTITDLTTGQVIYSSSGWAENLGSFDIRTIAFSPSFSVTSAGRYQIAFVTQLANDEDESNDELSFILRSYHDVKVEDIGYPFDEITVGWEMAPMIEVKNMGSYTENVDLIVTVYDSLDNQVFVAASSVSDLEPYAEEVVILNPWEPSMAGLYRIEAEAIIADDYIPGDNIAEKYFQVVDEMIYDDGMSNASFWPGSYPNLVNRKFGQRFMPNITAPFTVSMVRFYQPGNIYNGYFDYIGVCTEMGGYPDTNNYLQLYNNPQLPGPENWATYDFNIEIHDNSPLWFILKWADNTSNGPYIGADADGIIDMQSYWYCDQQGWSVWNRNDWMIRMTLEDITGTESYITAGLPSRISLSANYPNPFNSTTNISFGLPYPAHARIDIFNQIGQLVKILVDSRFDAGYHSVKWDGTTDKGDDAASGVYYYKITAGDRKISRKMVLLK